MIPTPNMSGDDDVRPLWSLEMQEAMQETGGEDYVVVEVTDPETGKVIRAFACNVRDYAQLSRQNELRDSGRCPYAVVIYTTQAWIERPAPSRRDEAARTTPAPCEDGQA